MQGSLTRSKCFGHDLASPPGRGRDLKPDYDEFVAGGSREVGAAAQGSAAIGARGVKYKT